VTLENLVHGYNSYYNRGSAVSSQGAYDANIEEGAVFADIRVSVAGSGTDYDSILQSLSIGDAAPVMDAGTDPDPACAGVPFDIFGNSRPAGGSYDIGPVEVDSAIRAIERRVYGLEKTGEIRVWPNPFSTSTEIRVKSSAVPQFRSSTVNMEIQIYNIHGKLVEKQVNCGTVELQHCGTSYTWHATGHPAGIYTLVVNTGNSKLVKRVTLVR
jgi:hypothetical protein